jgi:hypothetical protein
VSFPISLGENFYSVAGHNGIAIPPVLIFMLLLVNKKELMGEYLNFRVYKRNRLGDDGHNDRLNSNVSTDIASGPLISFVSCRERFRMGDQGGKTRVTVEGIEIRILFNFQSTARVQPMIECLPQQ